MMSLMNSLLLLVLLAFVAVSMYLSHKLLRNSEVRCKWVNRQCKFLDAILADIATVKESVEKIREVASKQIGVSELNSLEGIAQSLRGIEVQDWEKKARYVSDPPKDAMKNFEYLWNNRSNKFFTHWVALADLFATIDNWMEVKRAAVEMKKHVRNQQQLTKKLCELLEQTRERVWSLQERSVERASNNAFLATKVQFDKKMGQALEGLKGTGIRGKLAEEVRLAVIKVKLVVALVRDLRFVRLESEIERAWGEEAVADINEAQSSIFEATEAEERMVRYPISFGLRNWRAKSKIRKRIAYFETRFSELLEAKAWYGIEFLRRESKKHVRRRFQFDDGVLDVLAAIRRELEKIPAESNLRLTVSRVLESLESIEKNLKEEKVEEGAGHGRKACFDLLKNTANEVDNQLRNCGAKWKLIEMRRISTAVDLLQEMSRVCSIKVIKDSCSPVGIDEDVHELVSSLVSLSKENDGVLPSDVDGCTDEPTVVAIMGMQGIGKTALAKELMNNSNILNHFTRKVCIVRFSELNSASSVTDLLTAVGKEILPERLRPTDKDLWISNIRSFLTENPCLVVLDDLPSKQAWDALKPAFPAKRKSIVIVTTASKEVSEHANPRLTHRMRLRTEEESWEFFTQLVQFPSDSDSKTISLAKSVVAKGGGLPVAIMHLGYLLLGKELKEAELTKVLDRDHIARNQWSTNWDVNKDDFQSKPDLGKFFSYSELFPDDVDIPARRLLALWEASGSVQSGEEPMQTLQDLVKRNMIQVVERKRNGNIKTCRFPSTLREIWVKDTRNKTARARSWSLFASHNRHLAYRFEDQDTCAAHSVHGLNSSVILKEEKYPRAIMFFDISDGNKPNEDIGNFLLKGIASNHRQFRELLVLDLEGVFRPQLPITIGKLKKLTYLGLRWTFIEKLPDSIGELSHLHTLDLKYTYVQTLPPSIWKLKALQHLYLSENCRIKHIPNLSSRSMRNLQTLCCVFLDHEGSALSSGLNKLPNLQKLGVTISRLPPNQDKWLGKGIAQLTKLRSLSLRSMSENGEPRELKLRSLAGLTSLTKLYLLGKLENPSVLRDLPQSLTEITLTASELDDDPVAMLTKLKGLKYLSLLSKAYMGTHMVFHRNHFPELLVLQIWSLPNLEILEIGLGAMPKLRELEIRICNKLRTTSGLTNLKTLQELKLTNMAHQEQVIENDFAAARNNSSERTFHCPSITKKARKLLET